MILKRLFYIAICCLVGDIAYSQEVSNATYLYQPDSIEIYSFFSGSGQEEFNFIVKNNSNKTLYIDSTGYSLNIGEVKTPDGSRREIHLIFAWNDNIGSNFKLYPVKSQSMFKIRVSKSKITGIRANENIQTYFCELTYVLTDKKTLRNSKTVKKNSDGSIEVTGLYYLQRAQKTTISNYVAK